MVISNPLLLILYMTKPKCKKTLSGRHLFMSLFTKWLFPKEAIELSVWKAHGCNNPQKCIACGIIDDTN